MHRVFPEHSQGDPAQGLAAVAELKDQVDRELPGLRSTLIKSIALRRAG
ncbi:hypothetical protein ACQP2X_26965 [Actinoplanes sp. CA-131856]